MTMHIFILLLMSIGWLALISLGGIVLGFMSPKSRGWFIPVMLTAGVVAVELQYCIFGLAGWFRITSTLVSFFMWGTIAEITSRRLLRNNH